MAQLINREIAARFDEVAQLLAEQGASVYRVEAYRRAAETLRGLSRSVADILREESLGGLERLPAIGPILARAIRSVVETGRLPMLHELGIDSLEALEAAAYDGRLERMPWIGEKRLAAIRDSLARRLARVRADRGPAEAVAQPPVGELLGVDREYRRRAADGSLRTIAPRRFNPRHEAWLPIMHTQRRGRDYTALFSNTPRAHELGRTRDWVVLYVDGTAGERRYTVVTAPRGILKGRRIVRGREAECLQHYKTRGMRVPEYAG